MGGFGTTYDRQQYRSRFLYNRSGFPQTDFRHDYANEGWYIPVGNVVSHTSGYAEGGVILDFEDSTMRLLFEKHYFENVDNFRRKDPRYSRDYAYECLFRQSGSVVTQGSLCPTEGDPPRFLQLYIYDTENEVANRMRHFGGTSSGNLDPAIVQGLIGFLDKHNELVRLFRTARDKCAGQFVPDFKIRLYSVVGAREYDLPTSQTLGGIVFQNGHNTKTDYDVIIKSRGGPVQRINKLHPSYMSLQFPLLFIFGQPKSSIPVSTIATPPNTSETMQAANTGHLDKTEKTTTKRPKTLKRTLFPSEPQDQKKNKID
ncbi:hypothetical protein Tco_0855070 [Tanacetum coccineum]